MQTLDMPSFDIVSEVDKQELDNAVNQARKELATRFDLMLAVAAAAWAAPEPKPNAGPVCLIRKSKAFSEAPSFASRNP